MSSEMIKNPEEMVEFFNLRVDGYDEHMKNNIENFDIFYDLVSKPIEKTENDIEILDLGCGTGLEFEGIIEKAPNAGITGVDMCGAMLSKIKEKYENHMDKITLVEASYLTVPMEESKYDYAISVMTLHHLLHDIKCSLYEKIRKSLKPGGKYIEGDFIVPTMEEEKKCLDEYKEKMSLIDPANTNLFHIDIPFTVETQVNLLYKAGFSRVEVIWNEEYAAVLVAYTL